MNTKNNKLLWIIIAILIVAIGVVIVIKVVVGIEVFNATVTETNEDIINIAGNYTEEEVPTIEETEEEVPEVVNEEVVQQEALVEDIKVAELDVTVIEAMELLDAIAVDSTFYVIERSNGYDDYISKYNTLLSDDCKFAMQDKFALYSISDDEYSKVISPDEIINAQGQYPIYDSEYEVKGWGTLDEYAANMKQLHNEYVYTLVSKEVMSYGVVYIIQLDSIQRKVTLYLDEDYLVSTILDEDY